MPQITEFRKSVAMKLRSTYDHFVPLMIRTKMISRHWHGSSRRLLNPLMSITKHMEAHPFLKLIAHGVWVEWRLHGEDSGEDPDLAAPWTFYRENASVQPSGSYITGSARLAVDQPLLRGKPPTFPRSSCKSRL